MKPHTTHYACDAVLKKYGGKSIGCCCTGHACKKSSEAPVETEMNNAIDSNKMDLKPTHIKNNNGTPYTDKQWQAWYANKSSKDLALEEEESITREEAIELASGVHPAVYGRKNQLL